MLEAYRLHNGQWLRIGSWVDDDIAQIEPFDLAELQLENIMGFIIITSRHIYFASFSQLPIYISLSYLLGKFNSPYLIYEI